MSNLSGFVKRLRDIMRNDAGINGDAQRIEQIAWMLFLKDVYKRQLQDMPNRTCHTLHMLYWGIFHSADKQSIGFYFQFARFHHAFPV